MKEPTGRLARWALELQHWNFDIVHRKGAMHKVPDALSRMFDEDDIEVAEVGEITDQWYVGKIQDVVQYPMKHAEWKVEDGLLYKYKRDPLLDPITDGGEGWRMVVPLEKRERVLYDSHCISSAGHLGVDKTYDRVAREYF